MKVEFVSRNYNESDRLVRIVENKLDTLCKFLPDDTKSTVKLTGFGKDGEQMKYTMEISITFKGTTIRAEKTSFNMWDNIDTLIPKLESQLSRLKDKRNNNFSKPASLEYDVSSFEEKEKIDSNSPKVVKVKNYSISIISVEQAIEEMELLDHTFYVFVNADDNKVSVVYKRLDGNYGLISPEY